MESNRKEIVATLKELSKVPSVRGKTQENAPFGKECAKILKQNGAKKVVILALAKD